LEHRCLPAAEPDGSLAALKWNRFSKKLRRLSGLETELGRIARWVRQREQKSRAAQRARWARASGLIRKKVPMTIALLRSPPALVIHSRQERPIVYLVRMDFVSKSYHSPNRFCRASHRRGDLANRVPGHLRHVLLLI